MTDHLPARLAVAAQARDGYQPRHIADRLGMYEPDVRALLRTTGWPHTASLDLWVRGYRAALADKARA